MAEKKHIHVTISHVDGPVFDGQALFVVVPGVEGEMTILPEHTALISPLISGVIKVKTAEGAIEEFQCEQGTVEVHGSAVSVLL